MEAFTIIPASPRAQIQFCTGYIQQYRLVPASKSTLKKTVALFDKTKKHFSWGKFTKMDMLHNLDFVLIRQVRSISIEVNISK